MKAQDDLVDVLTTKLKSVTLNRKTPGGAKTNKNRLSFEKQTDIPKCPLLCLGDKVKFSKDKKLKTDYYIPFEIKDTKGNGTKFKRQFKHGVQKYFEIYHTFDSKSPYKKLQPDECFLDEENKRLFVLEKKAQSQNGSVDEQLQTGPFKFFKYKKLYPGYEVRYALVLNKWFYENRSKYEHLLEYLKSKNIPVFWG